MNRGIKLQSAETQELYIYGEIGAPEWLDGITSNDVAGLLLQADSSQPLLVRINSLGGLAYEGIAIYNLLNQWAGTVNVRVDSIAASAASLIAMAGEKITMATGAMLNIHDPWALTVGPADEHRQAAAELDTYADSLVAIYSERTGMDGDAVRDVMRADTTYSADDAIEAGFATDKTSQTAVAACKDDAVFQVFETEQRVAAWGSLLKPVPQFSAADTVRIGLALTQARAQDTIIA